MKTAETGGRFREVEVLIVGLTTLMLLPLTCLYAMDLSGGMITPDVGWALAAAFGLFGLWMAVLKRDSFYQKRQLARWVIVTALAVGLVGLGYLMMGSWSSATPGFSWLILGAPIVVAIHHLVRLIRLRAQPPGAL